jgi:hypothetical protein
MYYTFSCLVWCINLGQHIEENPTKNPKVRASILELQWKGTQIDFLPLVISIGSTIDYISLLFAHKDLIKLQFKNTIMSMDIT